MKKSFFISAVAGFLLSSCAVVKQGEVGVVRTLGRYSDTPYTGGLRWYKPFVSNMVKVKVQTNNLEIGLNLPSKEGLNIAAEISILYNVNPKETPTLLREVGPNFERTVVLPVFRSAAADISSKFYAKDMHSGQRGAIEAAIAERMTFLLRDKGIIVEAVLIKSISLPNNLARAVEEKLEAEQQSLRMEFVLEQAKQQAQVRRVEAEGVRDAQAIITQGLNPLILQYKSIEAFRELAKSPNAKVIVSDGDLPMIYNMEGK